MKRIHEFEIRMSKLNRNIYLITSLVFFAFSIILKKEGMFLTGLFFLQPIIVWQFLNMNKDLKVLREYFLRRISRKKNEIIALERELIALVLIVIVAGFFRDITWYNIIICVVLGIIFENLRSLVQIEK